MYFIILKIKQRCRKMYHIKNAYLCNKIHCALYYKSQIINVSVWMCLDVSRTVFTALCLKYQLCYHLKLIN